MKDMTITIILVLIIVVAFTIVFVRWYSSQLVIVTQKTLEAERLKPIIINNTNQTLKGGIENGTKINGTQG